MILVSKTLYPIYQHQMSLVANDGFNIDYYVDEAILEANLMILSKLSYRAVETRSTVRQFQP